MDGPIKFSTLMLEREKHLNNFTSRINVELYGTGETNMERMKA
jgi:hypothetical protein